MLKKGPHPYMPPTSAEQPARKAGDGCIKAVLFDFDGTLTTPGALDFPAIRSDLCCPPNTPILEYIQSMKDTRAQHAAMQRLTELEIQAARQSMPNKEALETVAWIKRRRLPLGIITRNSRASVLCALENFYPLSPQDFNLIITREDPPAPKPSGEGILWAACSLHVLPQEILMVGDYLFDCQAGQAAGAVSVLLDPGNDPRLAAAECDHRIGRLAQIKELLKSSFRV